MARLWISGGGLVMAVAALKTYLVVQLAMPEQSADWAKVSGLFALFFALTAAVAYVSFVQLRGRRFHHRSVPCPQVSHRQR